MLFMVYGLCWYLLDARLLISRVKTIDFEIGLRGHSIVQDVPVKAFKFAVRVSKRRKIGCSCVIF